MGVCQEAQIAVGRKALRKAALDRSFLTGVQSICSARKLLYGGYVIFRAMVWVVLLGSSSVSVLAQPQPSSTEPPPKEVPQQSPPSEPPNADDVPRKPQPLEDDPPPPKIVGTEPPPAPQPVAKPPEVGYPIERVLRPITLPRSMFEFAAEIPVHRGRGGVGVAARFGVSDRVELRGDYSFGSVDRDGAVLGKTIMQQVVVRLHRVVAVQGALLFLFDPVSVGISLGVPLKVQLSERLALFVGRDAVRVRVKRFVPRLGDPRHNRDMGLADEINTKLSRGEIRVVGGVIVQVNRAFSIVGEGGVVADDFSNKDPSAPLHVSLHYAPRRWLDLGVRLGFDDLGVANDSITGALVGVVRR